MNASISSTEEITAEEIMGFIANGRDYIFAYFTLGPTPVTDHEEKEIIQMEHLKFLFGLKRKGKLALVGPVNDESELKGIMIFNTSNKEEVKSMLAADPFVQRGHFEIELLTVFGLPGDHLA